MKRILLTEFKKEAEKLGLPTARSHGVFWWRKTEEAWLKFRSNYGVCPSGHLFSLNRMTCATCGESDLYEVWKGGEK